jgi:tetratricopeptide (TPR) repeat protein
MRNGIIQLQMGQTAQARDTLERSLRLDFAPHQTLFYLGMAQAQLGDTLAAYETFSLCRTRFLDENTYLVTAELAANLGKTDEAEETLRALLASRPSPTVRLRALYVKAGIAIRRGDREEATRQLASLVGEAPDFEPAGILYANLLSSAGSRDAAVAEYQRVLAVIEKKLAAAEKDLAAKTSITAAAYGELRASITTLRAQRDAVRDRLKSLGAT